MLFFFKRCNANTTPNLKTKRNGILENLRIKVPLHFILYLENGASCDEKYIILELKKNDSALKQSLFVVLVLFLHDYDVLPFSNYKENI